MSVGTSTCNCIYFLHFLKTGFICCVSNQKVLFVDIQGKKNGGHRITDHIVDSKISFLRWNHPWHVLWVHDDNKSTLYVSVTIWAFIRSKLRKNVRKFLQFLVPLSASILENCSNCWVNPINPNNILGISGPLQSQYGDIFRYVHGCNLLESTQLLQPHQSWKDLDFGVALAFFAFRDIISVVDWSLLRKDRAFALDLDGHSLVHTFGHLG